MRAAEPEVGLAADQTGAAAGCVRCAGASYHCRPFPFRVTTAAARVLWQSTATPRPAAVRSSRSSSAAVSWLFRPLARRLRLGLPLPVVGRLARRAIQQRRAATAACRLRRGTSPRGESVSLKRRLVVRLPLSSERTLGSCRIDERQTVSHTLLFRGPT